MQTLYSLTRNKTTLFITLFMLLALALAACSSSTAEPAAEPAAGAEMDDMNDNMEDMDHDDDMDDMDHEHDDDMEHERIPNDGAVISLLSPADGTTFAADEDIVVEVAVEGFTLGEDNNHWHIYIDGSSWGMVTGQATSQVLRGVDPGEHTLSVHLANGDHIELEDGDSVSITVEE